MGVLVFVVDSAYMFTVRIGSLTVPSPARDNRGRLMAEDVLRLVEILQFTSRE